MANEIEAFTIALANMDVGRGAAHVAVHQQILHPDIGCHRMSRPARPGRFRSGGGQRDRCHGL